MDVLELAEQRTFKLTLDIANICAKYSWLRGVLQPFLGTQVDRAIAAMPTHYCSGTGHWTYAQGRLGLSDCLPEGYAVLLTKYMAKFSRSYIMETVQKS